ncbi:MAG: hypothetical protein K2H90_00005, partial [Oscillospiraceae bacterium]|nr:hypothetical protein [Oscillospiraceae bacterium]
MTRKAKRFIKKLMGFGYARNDAVLLQQYAVKSIFSYPHVMYTAQLYLKQTLFIHKSYGLFSNNKQTIKRILDEPSYSKYATLSTISLLEKEETIILKSKKLETMEPFSSIKP